jgi:hypothetical protein
MKETKKLYWTKRAKVREFDPSSDSGNVPVTVVTYEDGRSFDVFWGVYPREAEHRFETSGLVADDGITEAESVFLYLGDYLSIRAEFNKELNLKIMEMNVLLGLLN